MDTKNNYVGGNKKMLLMIGLIVIVAILLFVFLGKNNNSNGNQSTVTLSSDVLYINAGESNTINYIVTGDNQNIRPSFSSSDISVATVDQMGKVRGVSAGTTNITLSYYVNGNLESKICRVIVTGSVNQDPPVLNLSLENLQEGTWTTNNVTINVDASSTNGNVSIKYAINCNDDNCNYINASNNRITISNDGATVVTVVATDKNNVSTTKSITVRIDKNKPKLTLSPNQNEYVSDKDLEICAICEDNESGCKEPKTCKTFVSSADNQTITIMDNAGNTTVSQSFNVKIDKEPPVCKLSFSGDTIEAKFSNNVVQYGFDKNFLDGNETTKRVSLSASSLGEGDKKTYTYYVKNSAGVVGTCSIDVIKECYCRWCYPSGDGNCVESGRHCYSERFSRWEKSKTEYVKDNPGQTSPDVSKDSYYTSEESNGNCGDSETCYKKIIYENRCKGDFQDSPNYCFSGKDEASCTYRAVNTSN